MTYQALPDDLLLSIAETPSSNRQRLEAIKNISLTSKALALATRRFIFEKVKIIVGGAPRSIDRGVESAVEGLKRLFEANPSYFGFVKRLRIDSRLVVSPVGEGPVEAIPEDDYEALLADLGQDVETLVIHYASSPSEEAALCWVLSQRFPSLSTFHFSILPIHTEQQLMLRTAAFASPALVSTPYWTFTSLHSQQEGDARAIATCLPEALIRFLAAEDQPFEHLILSSNLPPRILQYLNKPTPLKYLGLTKFSEVMPLLRNQIEVPFFVGMDRKSLAVLKDKLEVEDLSCDNTGGEMMHWVKGPDCHIALGRLKTLQISAAEEHTIRFPFPLCSDSLSSVKVLNLGKSSSNRASKSLSDTAYYLE